MILFNTIIVSGKANVGKTTCLKMLAETLLKSKDFDVEFNINFQKNDYWCSFRLGTKRIGIITFGDDEHSIKRAFHFLGKCDYYICASHLYGKTVEAILYLKNEYNIINPLFVNKIGTTSNDKDFIEKDNKAFLEHLVFLLNEMLKIE